LEDFGQAQFAVELLLEYGGQQVNAYGDPHLGLHRVDRIAIESFDPQMLFDPLEEQLDLPTAAIKLRDRERGQAEVVGQEDQLPSMLEIVIV
jgi:hypothetical protein